MPSAQTLFNAALQWLGELEDDESPNATESANGLSALNRIIDNWNIREEMATSSGLVTVALGSGANSAALGTRVARVVSGNVSNAAGPTWPLEILDAKAWNQLEDKDAQSQMVTKGFYDRGFPTGTLYVSPRPSSSGLTANLIVWLAQSTFATLATVNTLLPGYELGLVTELAIDLSPNYEVEPSPALMQAHDLAMAEIVKLNASLWVPAQAAATQEAA